MIPLKTAKNPSLPHGFHSFVGRLANVDFQPVQPVMVTVPPSGLIAYVNCACAARVAHDTTAKSNASRINSIQFQRRIKDKIYAIPRTDHFEWKKSSTVQIW